MQGGENWIFQKEINANLIFWDSHWLEIWSNHFCPSMGSVYRKNLISYLMHKNEEIRGKRVGQL
jgi:hypothetical protein